MKKPVVSEIILASTSARRIELLRNTGIAFRAEASAYEEDMTLPLPPHELVMHLADGKAKDVSIKFPEALVIGGDTIVTHNDRVLGKPKSEQEALAVLMSLSGSSCDVISGVSLREERTNFSETFFEATTVHMREIPEEAIMSYIKTGIPFERAGGFGVQDIGGRFISSIEGDYFTLLGFPLFRVLDRLFTFKPSLISDAGDSLDS